MNDRNTPVESANHSTTDVNVTGFAPLVSPHALKEELPLSDVAHETVLSARETIGSIIDRRDDRMLVVVGPCSIHDPRAAIEYAERLAEFRRTVEDRLFVVMRVYFEKPRTLLGWRGFILDPALDGTNDIQAGLRGARRLLLKINELGVPAGSELLDPIVPQFIDDLVSWASIGARTTESQTHREMASGLSMPVGFKNGTDGSIETATNAQGSSYRPHSFLGIDADGRTCIVHTRGNRRTHLILRGGKSGPNYHEEDVADALNLLRAADLPEAIVIDCSHGNSKKDHRRQSAVLKSVVRQRLDGNAALIGAMVESNLRDGRQDIPSDPKKLLYGVSVTDACLGWDETAESLTWCRNALARSSR